MARAIKKPHPVDVNTDSLRQAIQDEYRVQIADILVSREVPEASSASKFGTVGINFRAQKPPDR